MTTIEKLRTLARELAGEAWDYKRRQLAARGRTGIPAGSVCGRAQPREWSWVVQKTGFWA